MSTHASIVLEPAAQALADATSKPPFLYELSTQEARKVLDDLQAGPIDKPDVEEEWIVVPAPVTDAAMDSDSYDQFATGYYLSRASMEWFWDAYAPDLARRREITASPNQATLDQLRGLPPTLLLVDEADVLRDEGEAYAAKLRSAGVPVTTVRYDGTVHDFMLLDSVSGSHAARAATAQAIAFLRAALGTG
jgi:acetyl esterase/lipase